MEAEHSKPGTRDSLLDTAERLFSEKGFSATSLREITGAAGANIASIHYHFGSKEDLIREVFARRCRPLNEERIRRLDRLLESNRPSANRLEGILTAFVGPVIEMRWGTGDSDRETEGQVAFARLIGRVMGDPQANLEPMMHSEFKEVFHRFTTALQVVLPGLPRGLLLQRFQFAIGAMAHCVLSQRLMDLMDPEYQKPKPPEEITRALVAFLQGGFSAPELSGNGGK